MVIRTYEVREHDDGIRKIADACPACGFKFSDRGRTKIEKSVWPVANLSVLAAAAAGTVFLIAWLVS